MLCLPLKIRPTLFVVFVCVLYVKDKCSCYTIKKSDTTYTESELKHMLLNVYMLSITWSDLITYKHSIENVSLIEGYNGWITGSDGVSRRIDGLHIVANSIDYYINPIFF